MTDGQAPSFDANELEEICHRLGDTMTGGKLTELLREARIEQRSTESTKWRRLRDDLGAGQRRDGNGNAVARFIQLAMAPVRFGADPAAFEEHREALNLSLAHAGLSIGKDGKLKSIPAATTLSEAQQRARGLRAKLAERGVHHDVLAACRAELVDENYFHAVLEATKSLAEKIRNLTGLGGDGAPLADQAFGLAKGTPPLAFNKLETETERSEHTGLHNLIKGVFGAFRNPVAHAPKVSWVVDERDTIDLMQTISLLHRRLDAAHVTPAAPIRRGGS